MSEAAVDDPMLGKVLSGRFQIVEPLGVGGMGRVYKAIQQPLDRVVALKVLNPRYDGRKDPGFERRFFLEASMTAKLKHPNTITVHDYGRTDDGIFFIAMEYLEGETLQAVIARDGPLGWQRAMLVGAQIARSLREAHKLGLVHRDLKPANVMLVSEGSSGGDIVKVLDFGLVKAFSSDLMEKSDTELTQAGVLLGSPLYMAPEQARAETDQRTDIYSLGVLLFQCIAGRPPFQGRESLDIIVKHVKERPPELNALRPDIPFDVNALVMKCLEKDPDRRYQSMDEVIDGMRAAVAGQGLSGFFVDPRTSSGAASPSISQSVRTSGATRMRIASPSFDALPVSASEGGRRLEPDDPSLEFEITDTAARSTRRRATVIVSAVGVVVGGVIIGGVLALRHVTDKSDSVVLSTTQPSSTSKPGRSNEPGPNRASSKTVPTNVEVTFDVDSEPTGATVTSNGQLVGTTPFSFRLVRTTDAPVQAELMFSLDGYVGTTVLAKGSEGHVPLRPTLLRKKAGPVTKPAPKSSQKTSKPSNDNGYKDDPYQ